MLALLITLPSTGYLVRIVAVAVVWCNQLLSNNALFGKRDRAKVVNLGLVLLHLASAELVLGE